MKVLDNLNSKADKKLEMSLEEYKNEVYKYLTEKLHFSVEVAENLMKKYDEDFQEFYSENLSVEAAGCGMAMNLL